MSGLLWQGYPCILCRRRFRTFEEYRQHAPACRLENGWRQRTFREVEGRDPHFNMATFVDPVFAERERPTLAPETAAERVDGMLREGRLEREFWKSERDNVLKRIWRWIRGDG